jgi:trimeric autotransporter adhesin
MNPLIQLKTNPPLLITLALLCFALSPTAKALLPPPAPDGGYPGANTAEGDNALFNLTDGINNTAVGTKALRHNTTGGYNVGIGAGALASNISGDFNMAIGAQALNNNTADYNSAIGFRVLFMNTTGNHLTGVGAGALFDNTTGSGNTATGADALADNTTGDNNTAVGSRALFNLVGGHENTAVGGGAGANYIGTESNNICIGHQTSGVTGENNNIRIGDNLPSNGIVVGSKPSGETFVNIGTGLTNGGVDIVQTATAGTMRLGEGLLLAGSSTFIGGVVGNPQPAVGSVVDVTMQVGVGPNFQRLGIDTSSRRFKEDIKPMDKVSEAIFKL